MQHTTETPKQYQCRHIFTDGRRCASPCLRQEEFCYYHHTTRKPIANPKQRRSRRSTFHLPLPEDRSAIQSSIGEVLQRIAANDIDPRRAGLLLYGLQIASLNLPKTQPTTKLSTEPQTSNQTVEEITLHPTLGILAPRAEVSEITERKSPVTKLLEKMMLSDDAKNGEPEPATISTLQATADKTDGSDPHDSHLAIASNRSQLQPFLDMLLRNENRCPTESQAKNLEGCSPQERAARRSFSPYHPFRPRRQSLNLRQSRSSSRLPALPPSRSKTTALRHASRTTLATHRRRRRRDQTKRRSRSRTTPPPQHRGCKVPRQTRQHGPLRTPTPQLGDVQQTPWGLIANDYLFIPSYLQTQSYSVKLAAQSKPQTRIFFPRDTTT
jgi:hypothetical protein